MGDDKIIRPARLVMIDKDGNESEICGTVSKVTVEPETVERDDTLFDDRVTSVKNYSSECSFEIKSITRKRFIKMLMAQGIARNGAKDIAEYVRKKYGQYSPMFLMMM